MLTHKVNTTLTKQASAALYALLAAFATLLIHTSVLAHSPTKKRVISLAPHITELIFAAGAGDRIVATVNSSNYPEAANSLPHVGDGVSINLESLLKYKPDLIYAWQNTLAVKKITAQLHAMNIKLEFIAPQNIHEIPDYVIKIGAELGTATVANNNARQLEHQLNQLRRQHYGKPVSVFIEIGAKPVYTLGNDQLTNSVLTLCGATNAFAQSSLVAPAVTVESVMLANPEVIIIAKKSNKHLQARINYWAGLGLKAAQQQQIYAINPDTLLRPGPRIIDAAVKLCEYLNQTGLLKPVIPK